MNAVITGATRGIGKAIASKLADAGYNIAICSRSAEDLARFTGELKASHPGSTICGLATDCADRGSLKRFTDFVLQHFTTVDVLVNNAGVFIPSSLLNEEDEVFTSQISLNLLAPYYLCKSFGQVMRRREKGHIFNISSVNALEPSVEAASYSVTKTALLALTTVLRTELRPFKVKVTALIPGATLTSSWGEDQQDDGSFILPGDVANALMNCLTMSPGCNMDEVIIRPLKNRF